MPLQPGDPSPEPCSRSSECLGARKASSDPLEGEKMLGMRLAGERLTRGDRVGLTWAAGCTVSFACVATDGDLLGLGTNPAGCSRTGDLCGARVGTAGRILIGGVRGALGPALL